jgi:polar amino acid transport system ATP-binding protein
MTKMSLQITNLTKSFPTRSGELVVLRGINLELPEGDALAILGPSGSGKSTLLHILGTLDRPTSGPRSWSGPATCSKASASPSGSIIVQRNSLAASGSAWPSLVP